MGWCSWFLEPFENQTEGSGAGWWVNWLHLDVFVCELGAVLLTLCLAQASLELKVILPQPSWC